MDYSSLRVFNPCLWPLLSIEAWSAVADVELDFYPGLGLCMLALPA